MHHVVETLPPEEEFAGAGGGLHGDGFTNPPFGVGGGWRGGAGDLGGGGWATQAADGQPAAAGPGGGGREGAKRQVPVRRGWRSGPGGLWEPFWGPPPSLKGV